MKLLRVFNPNILVEKRNLQHSWPMCFIAPMHHSNSWNYLYISIVLQLVKDYRNNYREPCNQNTMLGILAISNPLSYHILGMY